MHHRLRATATIARSNHIELPKASRKALSGRTGKRLIDPLPDEDRLHFLAGCEMVPLIAPGVLLADGDTLQHAYFPTTGYVSVIATLDRLHQVEVVSVGNEGMLGAQLALDIARARLGAIG